MAFLCQFHCTSVCWSAKLSVPLTSSKGSCFIAMEILDGRSSLDRKVSKEWGLSCASVQIDAWDASSVFSCSFSCCRKLTCLCSTTCSMCRRSVSWKQIHSWFSLARASGNYVTVPDSLKHTAGLSNGIVSIFSINNFHITSNT